MPGWLTIFLVKLIQPIVESIIDRMLIAARLSAIEKKQEAQANAFSIIAKAKPPEEYQNAADALSDAWNK